MSSAGSRKTHRCNFRNRQSTLDSRPMGCVRFVVVAIVAGASLPASAQEPLNLLEQHRARPSDWKLCHQIALAYTQTQNLQQAEIFYRKTLDLKPDFIPARKNLATVSWFLGKKTESEALF